ncbi:glucose dehydrogenase, partial [Trichonephila inaurata madagascariensis]
YHRKIYSPYKDKPFYWCLSQVLHPKGTGYVILRSRNPHDPPIINPEYFSHSDDLEMIVTGLKKCKEIGESEPLRKIGSKRFSTVYPGCEKFLNNDDEYFRCMARSILLTCGHPFGKCKRESKIPLQFFGSPQSENDSQPESGGCICDAKHNQWKYKYSNHDDC